MVRGVQVVCHNMTIAYILRMLQLVTHPTAHWHATQGYILEHRACGFVSPSYLSSVPPPPLKVAPDAAREVLQVSVSVLHVFECNSCVHAPLIFTELLRECYGVHCHAPASLRTSTQGHVLIQCTPECPPPPTYKKLYRTIFMTLSMLDMICHDKFSSRHTRNCILERFGYGSSLYPRRAATQG